MKKQVCKVLAAILCGTIAASSGQYDADRQFRAAAAETASGDVNGNGELSIADLVLFQKWLLAVPEIHLENWKTADLCEDNRLDVFDLCLMRRALIETQLADKVTIVSTASELRTAVKNAKAGDIIKVAPVTVFILFLTAEKSTL